MIEWFEKLFSEKNKLTDEDKNKSSMNELSQLKKQTGYLIKRLNQDPFKSIQTGKEALISLNDMHDRLGKAENSFDSFNEDYLRQEKQNLDSFLKVYRLQISTELSSLRKNLNQHRQNDHYVKNIDRSIEKIDSILKDPNQIEFTTLCRTYGRLNQFYDTLLIKIEEDQKKSEIAKPIEKIVVNSFSSEQLEQLRKKEEEKLRLLLKLNEFRKSLESLVSYLEVSAFKDTKTGIDTLGVLNGLKSRLLDENIHLETFSEQALNQEKQGLQNFITLESQELKKQLREFITALREKRLRGFHTLEVDQWIKEVDDLISQENVRFSFLCDQYAKFHQSYLALNSRILESAQQEYSLYLKKITELQIGLKCQTVQNSKFLAEYEKEQFLRLAESIQTEFKLITLDKIQAGDAEKKVALSNFERAFEALLGKDSLAQERSQYCARFKSSLDRECNVLSEDNKSLFVSCIKQTLLSGSSTLETLQDEKNPHSFIKLFQAIRLIDVASHNLQQSCKAYEKFVRQNPLNPLHSKNGIKHAENVTEHTTHHIQEAINTELSQILNRIANNGSASLEEDIRLFNQSIQNMFSHWQLEVAVNVSEKSGDKRHSFNNYVKFWMESSKANPFKRLNVNDINEEIAKQKNSIEFLFSFFSPNKQRFSHHDLRTFVRDARDKFEAVESRKEENKIFTQLFEI